jgi:iron complex outermembrane recepter protein
MRPHFPRAQTKERCVMGTKIRLAGALASMLSLAQHASAQDALVLPQINVSVTSSRVGEGITGASSSVITAEQIERSPAQSLPDILGQAAGIQVMHVLGGPTGTQDMVDLRGFGAFAQSNVLILVNGRRYQDFDLQGFDFSSIPLNSIERVEITRGNSGAVLYGDGAIGGVINIVTKTASTAPSARIEALVGSYGYEEGRVSASRSSGPWSISLFNNGVLSSGYRQNSKLTQSNLITNLNYGSDGWSGYVNAGIDGQHQGFPGALPNWPLIYPITLADPRASVTPFDWGSKKDFNITAGITRTVSPGVDLIVDAGVRRKFQRSEFFNYFNGPGFTFDTMSATPSNYINTGMTTTSLTPRLSATHQLFGVPNRLLTGIDLYKTQYGSDRYQAPGTIPIHEYNIRQATAAYYGMNTTSVLPNLDVSYGGRVQRNTVKAQDIYDAGVDPNAGFYASSPQAPALDTSEWQHAAHVGIDYRLTSALTLFGRAAQAFRLPNADERVGAGNPFNVNLPANFGLKTQTSHDVEGGVRLHAGRFDFESSVYQMNLKNEIHFIPALMVDVNLDPTRRKGWENSSSYQLTDDVRLRGGAAYTQAVFREGQFAGKDIPLVSRWSGNTGVTWNIWQKFLVLDVTARLWSERRMDNDQRNIQPLIPANATVDAKIGGEYKHFFWSAAVQNLLDAKYFDYAIASATTLGYYNGYPQPGRTVLLRAGATF